MARGRRTDPQLCWAVINMVGKGYPRLEIAGCLSVLMRTIERIVQRFRSSGDPTITYESKILGRRRKLSEEDIQYIQASIEKQPDIYLRELAEAIRKVCGIAVSPETVWRTLEREGYTHKQITKLAAEQCQAKRDSFVIRIGQYKPHQIVCVDESAVDCRTTQRRKGWAKSGERAQMYGTFQRGIRYSILPALSLDGILYSQIVEGSFTGGRFFDFVANLIERMEPYPKKNSVLVMDNCAIHKVEGLRQLVEARGIRLEYLPPYSPDLNPIEPAFSSIKAYLRKHSAEASQVMNGKAHDSVPTLLLLNRAIYSVTPAKAYGWFKGCGYISS